MPSIRKMVCAKSPAESPNIVVAPKFMNELKRLPDDVLSFNRAIEEVSLRQGLYNKEATLMDP